jgi:ATP-dependent helicase/nuclease subunit A
MSRRPVPRRTHEAQARASDPQLSAWVSANAGSGKTHVLAQRVIRLLLAGVAPDKILCLTFTKAAAANMSARVFDRLAQWTTLDDGALADAIASMTGARPSQVDLLLARRLFARTVETPGGLKVQTIHAFCERLLHLFPFEANVAARFEVIEDLRQADLLREARATALAAAVSGTNADLAEALATVTAETTSFTFDRLIDEMVDARSAIEQHRAGGHDAALAGLLGLAPGDTVAAIDRAILEEGIAPALWGEIARDLGADGSAKDSTGNRLARAAVAEGEEKRLAYLAVFLTKELEPRKDVYLVKPLRRAQPALCERLDHERDRLAMLLDRRRAARALARTSAVIKLGEAIVADYTRQKAELGLLDFDDLIAKTLSLLTRSDAAWVLYKLDAGIDHILVDEAQDTSSDQWQLLQRLAADFTTGRSARQTARTFFAVGDEKQSIFSFQGAAPQMFDAMRREFERRFRAAAEGRENFAHVPLHLSFRSVPAVLESVDQVFSLPENFAGLSFDAEQLRTLHESWKQELPGRVEIWQSLALRQRPDPSSWSMPLDVPDERDPPVLLAKRIAATIRAWTQPGSPERVHGEGDVPRPMRPGDVLVLVRVRNAFFEAMIRALKEEGVRVAGADRMVLESHIAVMDLLAAGRAALLRDDDLALACALKSPLVGLDDDDLMALAPSRRGSLADALDADPRYGTIAATLRRWRVAAGDAAPFDFYMMLLAQEGGRKRFAARLGPEADDAIDEFLRLALEHEREAPPSLARFLTSIEETELSVKRDMEAAGDSVRVMTVHAAKGLEAKVVFLADTCSVPSVRHDPLLFRIPSPAGPPFLVWSDRKADDPAPVRQAREEGRRQALEEYRRLLYVAMTRAEERLVIAGYEGAPRNDGSSSRPAGCWYGMILSGLLPVMSEGPAPWSADESILYRGEGARATAVQDSSPAQPELAEAPAWMFQVPAHESPALPPLRPSSALAAADRLEPSSGAADGEDAQARTRGILMHTLIQHLPSVAPERRRAAAMRYLASRPGALSEDRAGELVAPVLQIIEDESLAPLFGPRSRAEVAVTGSLLRTDGGRLAVTGQIDRLAETEEEVLIADFKSGAPIDPVPSGFLVQMALYERIVAPLYPGRPVRALLVWTSGPSIVELDRLHLDRALRELGVAT